MLIRKEIGYWSCWNPEPYSGSRSHRSQGEEKGDWLAALDEQYAP
jgi:hypothetical protein